MHPAFSVIFFTVSSGTGYGLLAVLGLGGALGWVSAAPWLGATGIVIGLAAVTAGLLSSTYHLGHPERSWRALSQWRSSWLSREGVLAVIAYAPAVALLIGWFVSLAETALFQWLGAVTALAAALTVYATAMIYRSLRTIPEWSNVWTVAGYLSLGLAGGAVWANAVVHVFGAPHTGIGLLAVVSLAGAWGVKYGYWRFIDTAPPPATPESATGLGHWGKVRPLEGPHTEQNYLLKEMGYQVARKHAAKLRVYAQMGAFALPLALSLLALVSGGAFAALVAILAAISVVIGLLVERWLFFAEATHVVTLYYGRAE
jgi:DMSO reductase anchor subunit